MPTPQDILDFWFGALHDGCADSAVAMRWYKKDAAFDREIRERFLDTHLAILRGECESWLDTAPGRLALLIVLDQFSRNMFRDTLLAFAADPRALDVALEGIARGHDRELLGELRTFMYLPLMHAENLKVQEQCVKCFETFHAEASGELKAKLHGNLGFAILHRDIVARFQRFPHRNKQLGRSSTDEEIAFLQQPGSGF